MRGRWVYDFERRLIASSGCGAEWPLGSGVVTAVAKLGVCQLRPSPAGVPASALSRRLERSNWPRY